MQVEVGLPKTEDSVMDSNSNISRKDIKEALVRAALKDEAFRESLLANPKFAVERALGRTLPDWIKVVLLQETNDVMYIVLPKDFPDDTANLSDAELETIAGGFLSTETICSSVRIPYNKVLKPCLRETKATKTTKPNTQPYERRDQQTRIDQ
jgi:hypothetical protein